MSGDFTHLCSAIVEQVFGKVVQSVADCLFEADTRTFSQIMSTTRLSRKDVALALSVLIKFRLVHFDASKNNPFLAEYSLKREDVLCLLRYSSYTNLIRTKYGTVGALIAEELLKSGSETATGLLLKSLNNTEKKSESIETYRDTFLQLITDRYIIKMPELLVSADQDDPIPKFNANDCAWFEHPSVDLQLLSQIQKGEARLEDAKDGDISWAINYDRFHQEFRDTIMVNAIERKLGENAAECFRYILELMYNTTDSWQRTESNHITFQMIKSAVEKKSNNLDLMKYLDQYISLIADDSLGFLRKISDMGGGDYVVDMESAFKSLAFACVEAVITERFGSKAARLFRVIRMKVYIEQEDLQKEAMIPGKEAKSLAYDLFKEQFIHVKIIKKPGGGGTGPAKSFFLFQIKEKDTVCMLLDNCFKALYNTIQRSNFEKLEHKGLIEKSQRLDSVVEGMKERGKSEDYIAEIMEIFTPPEYEILNKVKSRVKTLSKAELVLDETIFLLQMYQHHCTTLPTFIKHYGA